VIVWGNIWYSRNSLLPSGDLRREPVLPGVFPGGWEGLHVFDISDPSDPDLVASIETLCGSHTATGVPDLANDRLLVYNSPSSGACPGIDIVEVPLSDPASASYLRFEPAGRSCHDTGVILGEVNLTACAGGNGFTVWSMDAASGGSLEDPMQLYSRTVTGVTIGHSASFTWDGEVLIFGHEPGGGAGARCQATSSVTDRSLFFFEGDPLHAGTIIIRGRRIPRTAPGTLQYPGDRQALRLVGNYNLGYQSLTQTQRKHARSSADRPSVQRLAVVNLRCNGFIYGTDITRGLIVWNLSDTL
jgi:hypothetical protein